MASSFGVASLLSAGLGQGFPAVGQPVSDVMLVALPKSCQGPANRIHFSSAKRIHDLSA